MKYRINGEIVTAEDLAKHPDAKLWIKAIQRARRNAILSHADISGNDFDTAYTLELKAIGIEIIE